MSTATFIPARPRPALRPAIRPMSPISPLSPIQLDFMAPTISQRFDIWKSTPGGAQVLRIAYALSARYAARYLRTGRQVSVKLIWELLRYNVAHIRARREQMRLPIESGFLLNNDFTAYVARHIMARRCDWSGLFETREIGKPRLRRRVLLFEETSNAPGEAPGVNNQAGLACNSQMVR